MRTTRTVADVMTRDLVTVPADVPVSVAADTMRQNRIGDVLVVDDGVLRGVITDRDLVVRVLSGGLNPMATKAHEICGSDVVATRPDTRIEDAFQVMRDHAVHRLPVIDADDRLVGIVTIGDLAMAREPDAVLADLGAAPPNR